MSEYRKKIINALLNAENNNEFVDYLYDVISNLDINVKNADIIVLTNSDKFNFLAKMYPTLKEKRIDSTTKLDLKNLYFEDISIESPQFNILTICFSFYSKKRGLFNIGLGNMIHHDGVFIDRVDINKPEPFHLNPYTVCYTQNISKLQNFLEIIPKTKKDLDIYIPLFLFDQLDNLDYVKVLKKFKSIMKYNKDGSVLPVNYNDDGNTLSFKIIDENQDWLTLLKYSIDHVLLDKEPQFFIDVLVNFPDKYVWTGLESNFFTQLSNKKYTFSKKLKKLNLSCYQYKKLPNAYQLLKKDLDTIIKLGMILNNIQDIIEILNNHDSYYNKLNKLNNLI